MNAHLHKLVVIGAGSIGERHVRCFLATGRVEAAFVEPRAELRETIAARYHIAGFPDLDSALVQQNKTSQAHLAAVIATPAPLHVPQALQCVERGRHVLIEKPLGVSFDGVESLQAAVRSRGVVAAVAYVNRCNPVLSALRDAIHSGRFGRPLQLTAVCGQHFPTYRPAYRTIYYADRATGGGAIQDALTHVLNAGEWLLGPIDRLVADADHLALEGVAVEDTVHLLARHRNVPASYSLNQHQAPNEMTITIVCASGTLRIELPKNRLLTMTEPGSEWDVRDHGPQERDTVFVAQANRFLDAVEGRAAPACSLDEGLQTLRVNLAALASVEKRTWQVIKPVGN